MSTEPQELVVISGKGGTGKTSMVAAFAALAENLILADCDVDAADLHLVLEPRIIRRQHFSGGKQARIKTGHCTACGQCAELCRFAAITFDGSGNGKVKKTFRVDPIACEGCGVCHWFCPADAIEFTPTINGEWYVADTRHGPMVYAKLGIAEANSGKLVSIIRSEAGTIARLRSLNLVLIDGSPGIGCPVIASVTGADVALIVTEPTLTGLHDLLRVAEVTRHFGIPGLVCVNKWDLNPGITVQIERQAEERGLSVVGRVRYDPAVTEAQIHKQSVVEYQQKGCAEDIRKVWSVIADAWLTPSRNPRAGS